MAWLILFLVLLVVIGKFADFLLGQKGKRKVKNRLVNWYCDIAEGHWTKAIQFSAGTTEDFFSKVLGTRLLSFRTLVLGTFLSVLVSLIILVLVFTFEFQSWIKSFQFLFYSNFSLIVAVICLINALVDIPSLIATRCFLTKVRNAQGDSRILAWLFLDLIVAYIVLRLAVYMTVNATIVGLTVSDFALSLPLVYVRGLPGTFMYPGEANMTIGHTNFYIFAVSAAFPTFLHLVAVVSAYLTKVSRPITQAPLSLVLQRLEESPNGVFTSIAIGITAIVGVIAAALKVTG